MATAWRGKGLAPAVCKGKFASSVPTALRPYRESCSSFRVQCTKTRRLFLKAPSLASLWGVPGKGVKRQCVEQAANHHRRRQVGGWRHFKLPDLREALYEWLVETIQNLKVRMPANMLVAKAWLLLQKVQETQQAVQRWFNDSMLTQRIESMLQC